MASQLSGGTTSNVWVGRRAAAHPFGDRNRSSTLIHYAMDVKAERVYLIDRNQLHSLSLRR